MTAGGAIPPEKGLVRRFWKCSHSRGESQEYGKISCREAELAEGREGGRGLGEVGAKPPRGTRRRQ